MTAEIHPLHTGYKPHLVYSGEPKPKSLIKQKRVILETALRDYIGQCRMEGDELNEDAGCEMLGILFETFECECGRRPNQPLQSHLPSFLPCDTEPHDNGDTA